MGLSLIGWLGRNRSFYSFLAETPEFEYPTDFRLQTLRSSEEAPSEADRVLDNVLIISQRGARQISLSPKLIETVQRVLNLVYMRVENWKPAFDYSPHDWLYQAPNLESASRVAGDRIFNALLERVIELGGKTSDGRDRWSFCTLLLPNDTTLPIQQQILTVRAQTDNSPYEIGVTSINQAQTDSLSLKAFLSGQIVYFAETLPGQSMTTYQLPIALSKGVAVDISVPEGSLEQATRSALAIPAIGEYGISRAVLYIASEEAQAFSIDDQRVLRMISRMVEELLSTSQARRQIVGKLGGIINNPSVVDAIFQGFASETDFFAEIELLLKNIQKEVLSNGNLDSHLSILSVDIDNQSSIALKYGNRVARNLSQQMGLRIRRQTRLSDKYAASKLFHISADKYYWLLNGVSLEEAQSLALRLKGILQEDYLIDPSYVIPGIVPSRPVLPANMQGLSGVTVHLGVSSYSFQKLKELLQRYPESTAVKNVRALILAGIEGFWREGSN